MPIISYTNDYDVGSFIRLELLLNWWYTLQKMGVLPTLYSKEEPFLVLDALFELKKARYFRTEPKKVLPLDTSSLKHLLFLSIDQLQNSKH
jgi:hypothetical protein